MSQSRPNTARIGLGLMLTILAIEFLDELVDGVGGAAWPLIRDDLKLSYLEIGVLLSVPRIIGSSLEPAFGILADVGWKRVLVLGGGVAFALGLALVGTAHSFWALLLAWVVFNPASGAFVSLSQATLADAEPQRLEQNMARWALAGSLGNVLGPLVVSACIGVGLGWRPAFLVLAALAVVTLHKVWREAESRETPHQDTAGFSGFLGFLEGLRGALRALRRGEVLRWLVLLECADLMGDVFRGYAALYFVDVARSSESAASLAVAVLTGVGLVGDALLLPLLERVRGIPYLRVSAILTALTFPAFLLAPGGWKLVLLGALGVLNSGWYSILKARLYSSLPGQSGTALAVSNVSGLVGSLIPLALGALAERLGLGVAMWALLLGPIALIVGLPRQDASSRGV
jgi:FSR family fosmidomycin resistance protein-like MFS transporter